MPAGSPWECHDVLIQAYHDDLVSTTNTLFELPRATIQLT